MKEVSDRAQIWESRRCLAMSRMFICLAYDSTGVQGPEIKGNIAKVKSSKINAKIDLKSVPSVPKPAESIAPPHPGSFRNQARPRMDRKIPAGAPMWPRPGGKDTRRNSLRAIHPNRSYRFSEFRSNAPPPLPIPI